MRVVLALCMAVLLVGCSEVDNSVSATKKFIGGSDSSMSFSGVGGIMPPVGGANNRNSIFPLAIGNHWKYSVNPGAHTISYEIVDTTEGMWYDEGESSPRVGVALEVAVTEDGAEPYYEYWIVGANGWIGRIESDGDYPEYFAHYLFFPSTYKNTGDWSRVDKVLTDMGVQNNCWSITVSTDNGTTTKYYKTGIGLIREVSTEYDLSLTSYTVR